MNFDQQLQQLGLKHHEEVNRLTAELDMAIRERDESRRRRDELRANVNNQQNAVENQRLAAALGQSERNLTQALQLSDNRLAALQELFDAEHEVNTAKEGVAEKEEALAATKAEIRRRFLGAQHHQAEAMDEGIVDLVDCKMPEVLIKVEPTSSPIEISDDEMIAEVKSEKAKVPNAPPSPAFQMQKISSKVEYENFALRMMENEKPFVDDAVSRKLSFCFLPCSIFVVRTHTQILRKKF